MSQWQELLKLDSAHQERVRQLYDEKFSKEIRHCFSDWIESQNWDLAAADENEARGCFHKLLFQLQEQQRCYVQANNILQGPNFPSMNSYLQCNFEGNTMQLAMIISECLREEKNILASATQAQYCVAKNPVTEKQKELDNKVKELRKQLWEAERDIKSLEGQHDEHVWQNQENRHRPPENRHRPPENRHRPPENRHRPQRTGTDPQRTGTDHQRTGTDPQRTGTDPQRTGTDHQRTGTDPQRTGTDPQRTGTDPQRTGTDPQRTDTDPQRTGTDPQRTGTDPQRTGTDPQRTDTDPQRTGTDPQRRGTDPQRTDTDPQRTGTDLQRTGTDPPENRHRPPENRHRPPENRHRPPREQAQTPREQAQTPQRTGTDLLMVLGRLVNILTAAQQIVVTLVNVELLEWKHRQQKACIGSPTNTCLDQLQMWFTAVAEVLQQVGQQLKKLQEQEQKYSSNGATDVHNCISKIEDFRLQMFQKLLENALVVEKQPCMSNLPQRPLILRTGVKFTVKIRFLAKLPEFNWLLKVKPVFDKFREFIFNKDDKNISKVLDEENPGGGLVAEFAHLSSLQVTEELHIIKFVTQLQRPGLVFDIETSSLPVVVVSSTSQIPSAWALVLWCNMLTSEPKSPSFFLSPPPVTWEQLSQMLNWQFSSISEKGLNEDQLSMLRDKLVDCTDGLVHWSKFYKNDGVWIWIEGILDLIKKHLLDLWNDGCIMGFVSRDRAEVLLQDKQTGTFLLRFSESSKDGAITFSWVEHTNVETHVRAVEPYTKKDLSVATFPDMIRDYSLRAPSIMPVNPLLYLYPDIPKDCAFECYYSKPDITEKFVFDLMVVVFLCSNPTPPSSPPEMTGMDTTEDMECWIGGLSSESDPLFSETLMNLKRNLCE
ncbi:signal transducer and activator of transcription 1-alpha/beta-like [Diretmus argenteus]